MFVDILFLAFVSAFGAVVLLGHVLLLIAMWPDLFPNRRAAQNDKAEALNIGRIEPVPQQTPPSRKMAA
jgi:ABC-type antimicrobial peptide transport system permease subunit